MHRELKLPYQRHRHDQNSKIAQNVSDGSAEEPARKINATASRMYTPNIGDRNTSKEGREQRTQVPGNDKSDYTPNSDPESTRHFENTIVEDKNGALYCRYSDPIGEVKSE